MNKIRYLSDDLFKDNFDGYTLNALHKNEKVINFSPGPAQFPKDIMDELKNDINNSIYGVSPFEISHRSPEFNTILTRVNANMKKLMEIPDDFSIIWTQGGGHGQFSAVPLNLGYLVHKNSQANYIVTGTWSSRAYFEAKKFINAENSLSCKELPIQITNLDENDINIKDNDKYVYLCSNETVNGIEFREDGLPYPNREKLKSSKLIIDMSSDFTMKKINWNNIDVAFACTSKNLGIAGANITIVRTDLIAGNDNVPCVLDWNVYNKANSLYNTPAIYNIYIIDKFLKYYLNKGGIDVLESESKIKSKMIYDTIDESKLYHCVISDKKIRSNINIPFIVGNGNKKLMEKFLYFCYINNIVGLRTKTPFNYQEFDIKEPLRISLYNGVSIDDTARLVDVMKFFEKNY